MRKYNNKLKNENPLLYRTINICSHLNHHNKKNNYKTKISSKELQKYILNLGNKCDRCKENLDWSIHDKKNNEYSSIKRIDNKAEWTFINICFIHRKCKINFCNC